MSREPAAGGFPAVGWKAAGLDLCALVSGAVLFAIAFPNILLENGLALAGWFCYWPALYLVNKNSLKAAAAWGALYGFLSYTLFNYWLTSFHPLAGLLESSIELVYCAVLFFLLRAASLLFPRRGYLLQWALWLSYEYLRTLGFLGFSYGITGYTQWRALPVIQIAGIFGVWGVSALVSFPSFFLAWRREAFSGRGIRQRCLFYVNSFREHLRRELVPAAVWLALLAASLVYGFISLGNFAGPAASIALIQNNADPWKGGKFANQENLRVLKALSLEAIKSKPSLVVWPETAFVPRIAWHLRYRQDRDAYQLVEELLGFLASQDVPFVIGNDDGVREALPGGGWAAKSYNAALLFDGRENLGAYRKMRLVPFAEYFPYEKQLPFIYKALQATDTHFWERGEDYKVFESRGLKFSTPICFEDSFGYISREFTRRGAQLIVNLSNDGWSKSLPAQTQHLAMAVFRAVENRRSLVRSTATGQTCAIAPDGRILAMAAPFSQEFIVCEVPILDKTTVYTRLGDFLPLVFCALAALGLAAGLLRKRIKFFHFFANTTSIYFNSML